MEKICLELPLCKVRDDEPWSGSAYIKEHFPKGCFIIATEYNYSFAWHDGNGYMNEMGIDMNLIQDAIAENARYDEFMKGFNIMEEIENLLQQIARLTGECKDEVVKSENRLTNAIVEQSARQITEFNTIREGLEILEKGENIIMSLIPESEARLSEKMFLNI